MMRRAVLAPNAGGDVDQIAERIAQDSLDGALNFLDAIAAASGLLAANPLAGRVVEPAFATLPGLRVWGLAGFRTFLLFYLPVESGVRIIRVLHGAQNVRLILGDERPDE